MMNLSLGVCFMSRDKERAGEDSLEIVEVGRSLQISRDNWRDVCEQKKYTGKLFAMGLK